jgi:branched-chain amino acid aminotransferase
MSKLWINGSLTDKADAKISPFDHGFLYGDGVWEPLRVYKGQLFRPAIHLSNLFSSAEYHDIKIPLTRDELAAAIETTLTANNRTEGYIRVIITRGAGTLGPDPRKMEPQVVIIAEEYHPFPKELYQHGLHAVTFTVRDHGPRHLGQVYLVLAKSHALRNGCLEAVLKNPEGELIGTIEGFLFLVKDGGIVVAGGQPQESTGFCVAELAGNAGFVVTECAVRIDDLETADEAFMAGTSCGVIGIVRVDGTNIGAGTEGPITRQVRERFLALTNSL